MPSSWVTLLGSWSTYQILMVFSLLAIVARILTSCLANGSLSPTVVPIHRLDILGSQTWAEILLMNLAWMLVSAMIKGLNHVLRRMGGIVDLLATCVLGVNHRLHHIGQVFIPVASFCREIFTLRVKACESVWRHDLIQSWWLYMGRLLGHHTMLFYKFSLIGHQPMLALMLLITAWSKHRGRCEDGISWLDSCQLPWSLFKVVELSGRLVRCEDLLLRWLLTLHELPWLHHVDSCTWIVSQGLILLLLLRILFLVTFVILSVMTRGSASPLCASVHAYVACSSVSLLKLMIVAWLVNIDCCTLILVDLSISICSYSHWLILSTLDEIWATSLIASMLLCSRKVWPCCI